MKVLCLGDLSLDTYLKENKSFFGGCSLNVARQLNEKLGHKETALYIPLGNDQNSKEAQKYLETLTIEMRLKILEGELPRQPITIDENGERHLHDYVGGVLTEFTCEDLGKFFLSRFELISSISMVATTSLSCPKMISFAKSADIIQTVFVAINIEINTY